MAMIDSKGPDMKRERLQMVEEQLRGRGIQNDRVLDAMLRVPRHEFVPQIVRDQAHLDSPLPIGYDQTISQPYIVAFMTEAIDPQPDHRVLEVGAGSGYQAAVLAELAHEVFAVELIPQLAELAKRTLARVGYKNVHVRQGDGYLGWPDKAPFDAIVVSCGARDVPGPLVEQLKPGGRMIIPVHDNSSNQMLQLVTKLADGTVEIRKQLPVRFVPLRRAEDVFQN